MEMYQGDVDDKTTRARDIQEDGPLKPLEKIVPENLIESAYDNENMLQIVFFAIIFGVALLQIKSKKKDVVIHFFHL